MNIMLLKAYAIASLEMLIIKIHNGLKEDNIEVINS
jgi:hypothetical protein